VSYLFAGITLALVLLAVIYAAIAHRAARTAISEAVRRVEAAAGRLQGFNAQLEEPIKQARELLALSGQVVRAMNADYADLETWANDPKRTEAEVKALVELLEAPRQRLLNVQRTLNRLSGNWN
jgi:hypothetical protein